jgi:Protein kinase domain
MSTSSGSRDYSRFHELAELAEEYGERYRQGERPSVEEYVDRFPELADAIRAIVPSLVAVEQVKGDALDDTLQQRQAALPPLRELGDYRIVRELGRGGMGVVYEAEQVSLGRRVALKVLPRHVSGDRMVQERFRRKARAAARLHHTNIVPVYEVGHDKDIGRQVAGGLAYALDRGIVHRDIKPSNLLLDTEGVVWITDFGLAKGDDEGLTQSGDILGTIRYTAPERFRGEGDVRADIYALGLTLYELLTLRSGFHSRDRLELIERIKTVDPERPRSLDGRIPRDLETIVLKAIEKDPKARYQSAEAMGEDLGRFLDAEPIRARQVSAAERYWRWCQRNKAVAGLLGVIALALVLGTAVSNYFAVRATRGERLALQKAVEARENARRAAQETERANLEAHRARDAELQSDQRLNAAEINLA